MLILIQVLAAAGAFAALCYGFHRSGNPCPGCTAACPERELIDDPCATCAHRLRRLG